MRILTVGLHSAVKADFCFHLLFHVRFFFLFVTRKSSLQKPTVER